MNFLAHIFLSGEMDEIMVGNFMGDFVKGKNFKSYSPEIVKGIKLHREIDWYTDNHPVVDKSKDRLWENYRHYSSVIIDMYYDHFLAKDWDQYSDIPLNQFVKKTYNVLNSYKKLMPEKAQHMLPYMIRYDWLNAYQHVEGIHRSLSGMARRTKFKSHMEHASKDLKVHYTLFQQEFHDFFPDVIKRTEEFKQNLSA